MTIAEDSSMDLWRPNQPGDGAGGGGLFLEAHLASAYAFADDVADLAEQPERAGRAEAGAPVDHPDLDRLGRANPTLHNLPFAVCWLAVIRECCIGVSLGLALPACPPGC